MRGGATIKNILPVMGDQYVRYWRFREPVVNGPTAKIHAPHIPGHTTNLEALNLFHDG
jgi:hypothetical protein